MQIRRMSCTNPGLPRKGGRRVGQQSAAGVGAAGGATAQRTVCGHRSVESEPAAAGPMDSMTPDQRQLLDALHPDTEPAATMSVAGSAHQPPSLRHAATVESQPSAGTLVVGMASEQHTRGTLWPPDICQQAVYPRLQVKLQRIFHVVHSLRSYRLDLAQPLPPHRSNRPQLMLGV